MTTDPVEAAVRAVAEAHRLDWARVLASTAQLTRDLDLAEECAQDAFAQALQSWPVSGVPDRPGAWLTTVARNRARDVLRRSRWSAGRCRYSCSTSTRWRPARTRSTTTGCGSSSPAATRRWPGRRGSR